MPSPFPGADPYLEAPDLWPDFHDAFAAELRGELNRSLPPPYYARLEMRPEVGILEGTGTGRRIVPDVSVVRSGEAGEVHEGPGSGLRGLRRTTVSPSVELTAAAPPLRHPFLEIRDSQHGHRLVTLIEIVSPSNKRPGPDRRAYQSKQNDVLESDASLIEIDLLRHGERLLVGPALVELVAATRPAPDYLVLVNRAWRRVGDAMDWQVFPFTLRDPLPCIPVPLRPGESEVPLDLQWVFHRAFEAGPYLRGAVDYRETLPDLGEANAAWADELLQRAGLRLA